MSTDEVVKYRKPVIILHWIHTGAFILLFLTGLIQFIPALGFLAENSSIRLLHRVGAAVFIIAPIIYLIINPAAAGRGLKKAFTWGREDLQWLRAAPRYYFLGDEKAMPPQGEMNSGQKFWWLITIVFGVLLAVSGLTMAFAKTTASPELLQVMVHIHDIAFIVTGAMFLLHIYLGAFSPMTKESLKAMTSGKISAGYARKHHGKWYAEITKDKSEQ